MTNHPARFVAHHTLCELELNHPEIALAVLDPHEMHRLVMRAFLHWVEDGARDARAQMRVLHTYVTNLATDTVTLIVQSRVPGDWSRLPRAAWIRPPATRTVDLPVKTGQTFQFRTVINPNRYAPRTAATTGTRRRLDQRTPTVARTLQWFTGRLQPYDTESQGFFAPLGADTDPATLTARILPTLASHSAHIGMRVPRAEIQGQLTVTHPEAFAETLRCGMGRSRAYGCGLLLAQPIAAPITPAPRHQSAQPQLSTP
ncbi:type I-E CRISPR-associated protein Cas6/Cse3/CasE [Streptomyces xanthochromogenes]|uniref:type I-E CRISPR-associated protein Cas6/Cse3/CasE n=1 Tax=Streptomyces xanthochromogenes TaxID=67384 RepID=UPI0034323D4E